MDKKIIIGILGIIVVALGFIIFNNSVTGKIINEGETIKIPTSEINDNAEFYNHEGIEFFTVKDSNGEVKTAFNACDVCYGEKKGYRQEGNFMICNNCRNKYPISGLGTENLRGGGCWPGYLPTTIEGDYLIIKKSDLENGRYRFN